MESFDLNLENYKFTDILKLFHLSVDLTETDLKKAKIFVYKSHPDRSRLDEFFCIFFQRHIKIRAHLQIYISTNFLQSTSKD